MRAHEGKMAEDLPLRITIEAKTGKVLFWVRVRPRANENAIIGFHDQSLKIRLKAAPEDGQANNELVVFLAEIIGIGRTRVEILQGKSSRKKCLALTGVTPMQVMQKLTRNIKRE